MPAYRFTGVTATAPDGTVVRQIRQRPSGPTGGYIQSTANLDAGSAAWVEPNAMVWGDALVDGSALITGDARVYGSAHVTDDAVVSGSAQVYGEASVGCSAVVTGTAEVFERASICGDSLITKGRVRGTACWNTTGNGYQRQVWTGDHFGCHPWYGTPL